MAKCKALTGLAVKGLISWCLYLTLTQPATASSHSHGTSEIAILLLQQTFRKSVLLYAVSALTLHSKQTDELNACWNNAFIKTFGYRRYASVKDVIYGLGRVRFKYFILLQTVKFYK